MRSLCKVCGYPIRKPNRTVHVTCAQTQANDDNVVVMISDHRRACSFCLDRDTTIINGAPFCPKHMPTDDAPRVRSSKVLTLSPERCERCDEVLTPTITKGKIKCKCDEPMPPRPCKPGCTLPHKCLTEAAWLARMGKVPTQTRYGN